MQKHESLQAKHAQAKRPIQYHQQAWYAGGEAAFSKLVGEDSWKQLMVHVTAYRMQPALLTEAAALGHMAGAAAADMVLLFLTGKTHRCSWRMVTLRDPPTSSAGCPHLAAAAAAAEAITGKGLVQQPTPARASKQLRLSEML